MKFVFLGPVIESLLMSHQFFTFCVLIHGIVLSSFGFRNGGKTLVTSAISRKESLVEELSLFEELMISFQQRSILVPLHFHGRT